MGPGVWALKEIAGAVLPGRGGDVFCHASVPGDQVRGVLSPRHDHDFYLSACQVLYLSHDLMGLCHMVLKVGC